MNGQNGWWSKFYKDVSDQANEMGLNEDIYHIKDLDMPLQDFNNWLLSYKHMPEGWPTKAIDNRDSVVLFARNAVQKYYDQEHGYNSFAIRELMRNIGTELPETLTYVLGDSHSEIVNKYVNNAYSWQSSTEIPAWLVDPDIHADAAGTFHDVLQDNINNAEKSKDLARVWEAYYINPTSQFLKEHHQTTIQKANQDSTFAKDVLGETTLWDDPTIVHSDKAFREVAFDDGLHRRQLDVLSSAPQVLHKEVINNNPPEVIHNQPPQSIPKN